MHEGGASAGTSTSDATARSSERESLMSDTDESTPLVGSGAQPSPPGAEHNHAMDAASADSAAAAPGGAGGGAMSDSASAMQDFSDHQLAAGAARGGADGGEGGGGGERDGGDNGNGGGGMGVEEMLYSMNSFLAVIKPVATTMVLASLVVVNLNPNGDDATSSGGSAR